MLVPEEKFVARSWVEIDTDILVENCRLYAAACAGKHDIMAVVKANAYGHGAVRTAKALAAAGIKFFAVSNIEEAEELRNAGIEGMILILGYTPIENLDRAYEADITQTLVSEEYAQLAREAGAKCKFQFAIDTGMNRIGLDADDADKCARTIKEYSDLNLTGIFTHLCAADTDEENEKRFTLGQIEKFNAVAERIADLKLPYMHCLNTAGGLRYKCDDTAFVRLGISLYGLKPNSANTLPKGIKGALRWRSAVSVVKYVEQGETVGYGRTFTAEKRRKIATVSTGYADGFSRLLSNRGKVIVNGKFAPIVGRICMDQFMIDITDIGGDVKQGTTVTLLGRDNGAEITADDIGELIGSIGYEVVCGISERVTRVYTKLD